MGKISGTGQLIADGSDSVSIYKPYYRLYSDNWCEQGARLPVAGVVSSGSGVTFGEPVLIFPVDLDNVYHLIWSSNLTGQYWSWIAVTGYLLSNTKLRFECWNNNTAFALAELAVALCIMWMS